MKYLLIALLLIPTVSAVTVLDDWVDHPSTFELADHEFSVQYLDSKEKLILKMDGLGGLLDAGECEIHESIEYCFLEANLIQVKLKIDSLQPDIKITREFSTKKPLLNEKIEITTTVTNSGDKRASNVNYEDLYTSKFKKSGSDWTGNLNPGEEKKISYTVTPIEIDTFNSIAEVTYEFDGKKKKKFSKTILIEVLAPYSITHSLSPEAAEKNELINYNITLTNKDESSNLEVTQLKIFIPSKMNIKKAPSSLKQDGNILTFKGTLEKEEQKNFIIQLASSKVGTVTLELDADLVVANKPFKEHLEKEISIGLSDIIPLINLPPEIESNAPYEIYIAAKNVGKESIAGITLNVKSDLIDAMSRNKKIDAKSTYELFDKKLIAPYTDTPQTFTIELIGSYTTASGKDKTFEKKVSTLLKPTPQVIQILRTVDKKELLLGDTVSINVKIKNKLDSAIENIDISDIFPKEVRSSLVGEVTKVIALLQPNQELDVYAYSVTVPEDYDKSSIEFKTVLSTKRDGDLTILKRTENIPVINAKIPTITLADQKDATTHSLTLVNTTSQPTKNSIKKFFTWLRSIFKPQSINSTT